MLYGLMQLAAQGETSRRFFGGVNRQIGQQEYERLLRSDLTAEKNDLNVDEEKREYDPDRSNERPGSLRPCGRRPARRMFTVPAEAFRGVAERLKAEGFDFLRSLTGMPTGAKRASAWCTTSKPPSTGENGSWCGPLTPEPRTSRSCLRSATCGRPRSSTSAKSFDYLRHPFPSNHPDMRRLYLRDDWVGLSPA